MPHEFIPLSLTAGRNSRWVLPMPWEGRAVTVNAAFFREIKDENRGLQEVINTVKLFAIAGVYRSGEGVVLARHLKELRQQIRMQFALEQAYGYFDGPISVDPETSRRATALRAEHAELWSELESLYGQARRAVNEPAGKSVRVALADRVDALVERFELHQRDENELIQFVGIV
jgi:hypothetical protein